MNVTIHKHFDYLTPFTEATNDDELAKILRLKYPKACSNLEVDAGFFARMVEDVRKFEAWRVIGFASFEEFCREELGRTLDEVEQIVDGVRVLSVRGGPITEEEAKEAAIIKAREQAETVKPGGANNPKGNNQYKKDEVNHNSVMIDQPTTKQGNGSEYLLRRLARHHPEILARFEAGEFKSVRQAAIEAGIIKIKSPLEKALDAFRKLKPTEKESFLALI